MTVKPFQCSGLFFIVLNLLLLVNSSCQHHEQIDRRVVFADSVRKTANQILSSRPSEALALVRSIDTSLHFKMLPDTLSAQCFQTEADALVKTGFPDSAFSKILHLRERAKGLRNKKIEALFDLWLTENYTETGKFYLARKYCEEALILLVEEGDRFQLARACNMHGSVLRILGEFEMAQKQFLKAADIFEHLGRRSALGAVYINLGNNYLELNERDLGLSFYRKAEKIALEFNDTVNYISTLNNLSRIYQFLLPDSSEFYVRKIIEFNGGKTWSPVTLPSWFQLAGVWLTRKEYQKSLALYRQILDSSMAWSVNHGVYRAYSGIGNCYEGMGMDQKALSTFEDAARLAGNAGESSIESQLLDGVLYMHKKMGNYRKALEVLERNKRRNDSILSIEKQLSLHDLELMYNNEKAERRNDELTSRMLFMKREIRLNYIILSISVIFTVILFLMLVRLYRIYRQRDAAYRSLIEKYRVDMRLNILPEITPLNAASENKPDSGQKLRHSQIFESLVRYFEEKKPFLNPKLKIEDVSAALNIPRKTISAVLSDHGGMHFIAFVNNHRVREALKLLSAPEYQNIKIEHIAREAGFGSKVSFYTAFTQVTGHKPASYREKN